VCSSDLERPLHQSELSADAVEKGTYAHYMLKEIHEQPRAVTDTLRGRLELEEASVSLEDVTIDPKTLKKLYLVACGTSWHAALCGKFLIEGIARIPVEVDLGSEFRYRDPLVGKGDLLVAISQSGETADTLAAMREAQRKGARALGIVNVVGSTIARESNGGVYIHAGPEIGVASTKAFTTQLVGLFLLALALAQVKGRLSGESEAEHLKALRHLPVAVQSVLALEPQVIAWSEEFARKVVEGAGLASDALEELLSNSRLLLAQIGFSV
jgi:glucosamine--fructose-6-phosphate aminotransferase (isomerizing)